MKYLELEAIKRQVVQDSDIDDTLLTAIGDAAEDATERHLGRTLGDCIGDDGQLPPALYHAMLMLCATLYNDRESLTHTQTHISPAYEALIGPFRKY